MAPDPPPHGVFGRDEDVVSIMELLAINEPTVTHVAPVAILGLAGIGKTTLAAAVARQDAIREALPDGVFWAALGPEPKPRFLLEHWGARVGLDLVTERDVVGCTERLRDFLFNRRVLVVLDDVWDSRDASPLLVGGPRCRTVVTTRETPPAYTLATRSKTKRVDVLSPEASLDLLDGIAHEVVAKHPAGAAVLCERLEYLPLGLTLAGRHLNTIAK